MKTSYVTYPRTQGEGEGHYFAFVTLPKYLEIAILKDKEGNKKTSLSNRE